MYPMIAVTMALDEKKYYVNKDYIQSIVQAGGIPFVISNINDPLMIQKMVRSCDGLLLTGGEDVDPNHYGEEPLPQIGVIVPERDELELHVVRLFLQQNKPIFAICRGCQLLNVAFGGDLYQDIPSQTASIINHEQKAPRGYPYHSIKVFAQSLLYRILQQEKIRVNSYHHQAAKTIREPLRVCAIADDGIVEAIESSIHDFVLGVQWHPEGMAIVHDKYAQMLFDAFIHASQKYKN
ncbi:gamma-glutamyl-gamma-aminobutyrate hydrolase family protein [Shimazuella alba]|uniref:Gamma-glutamyl-gamma-aminobutyrate hydrolase family protein n=1 Tax=Shimazuella alba TaxID=2690964 RepID=A0A6I4VV40_9BACL|nr:gamma-glutamyl-gamma-aminobutyrate hydrolase family protein [Shimazuella alba]MXQ53676.1 gamma-glutamyl-gamma-aminobutyrate hydrolase family protein [Shimazuella alba]